MKKSVTNKRTDGVTLSLLELLIAAKKQSNFKFGCIQPIPSNVYQSNHVFNVYRVFKKILFPNTEKSKDPPHRESMMRSFIRRGSDPLVCFLIKIEN